MCTLRNGRQFFSLREGLPAQHMRPGPSLDELTARAQWHSPTLCQKSAISRSVKTSTAVLQAVSQKKHVMKARVRMKSAPVGRSVLSAAFAEELSWRQIKTPPLTTEGKNGNLVFRNNPLSEPGLDGNPRPKSERRDWGDICRLVLYSVTTSPSLHSPLPPAGLSKYFPRASGR
jgi:hypothetical protein